MTRPAAFLDRDGTIIVEKHYLSDPALVELESGAIEGMRQLQALGLQLVVVTNQSGVGRGKFTVDDAHRVNARVGELLAQAGIEVTAWYMCPHAPSDPCGCRKPLPGMAHQAREELGVEFEGSFVVGDKRSDVEMADAIGATGILVTTGHGTHDADWAREAGRPIAPDLAQAARLIAGMLGA